MTPRIAVVSDRNPPHQYRFLVRGAGLFPIEMLRFSSCRAESQADQDKIDWQIGDWTPPGTGALYARDVWLRASLHHGIDPNLSAEWARTGWRVIMTGKLRTVPKAKP
jgi:hypothetical protein